MNTEMTLNTRNINAATSFSVRSAMRSIANASNCISRFNTKALTALAAYYSNLLEEEVSVERTKALVKAQVAFFATILPVGGCIFHLAAAIWFVISLTQVKGAK